ncbi:GNAT family N-acetyltransferase [Paenibacillus brevis]|uniref:GNAT family N-acetyltransferase n=1 Tax=Paenibacillus brevis TaxID=2841508 RepID=A0ABS6FK68_9BACL|nr:GNAT family N-acetyltransferase [Paenibacillus brevis]MBU5670551.1 GNAT family N-acetyltransferase [Paenibacillus brevis]
MQMILRESRQTDEHDIAEVIMACHWESPVADHELLALRWIRQFLVTEPQNGYVLEHPDTGKVVGYIVCVTDTMVYEHEFEMTYFPQIMDRFNELEVQGFEYLEENRRLLSFTGVQDTGIDLASYPAHLHINILPAYQRSGYGGMLLSAYEENLRKRRVQGYHLGTAAGNTQGISFYKKHALDLLHTTYKDGKPAISFLGKRL